MSVTHALNGLRIYTASADDDLLIGQWYLRMANDGDLAETFTEDSRSLAALYRMVSRPKTLVYAVDAEGIWMAMWGEQIMRGAFVGMWTRRDRRHTRRELHAMLDAETWYLQSVPTLFVVTRHRSLLSPLRRLGYNMWAEPVEGWMDGHDAWIGRLTRAEHQKVLWRYKRPSVELEHTLGRA